MLSKVLFPLFLVTWLTSLHAVTIDDIQGNWSLSKSGEGPGCRLPVEEYYPPFPDENLLIISNDTLTKFEYPYFFLSREKFEFVGDTIYTERKRFYARVQLDSGRMIFHMRDCYYLVFTPAAFGKDTLQTISVLLHDTINPNFMLGKLTMVTHFVPDDEEAYDFTPPIKMPGSITIADTARALNIIHKRVIYLQAGNKVRPFYVEEIDWDPSFYAHRSTFVAIDLPYVVIYPAGWWTGDPFEVRYEMKEIDWVNMHPH